MKACKFCNSKEGNILEVPIVNASGSEWMHKHCGEKYRQNYPSSSVEKGIFFVFY